MKYQWVGLSLKAVPKACGRGGSRAVKESQQGGVFPAQEVSGGGL